MPAPARPRCSRRHCAPASASDFAVDVEFAEPLDRSERITSSIHSGIELPVAIFGADAQSTRRTGGLCSCCSRGGPLHGRGLYESGESSDVRLRGGTTDRTRVPRRLSIAADMSALMAAHCNRFATGPYSRRAVSHRQLYRAGSAGQRRQQGQCDARSSCLIIIRRARCTRCTRGGTRRQRMLRQSWSSRWLSLGVNVGSGSKRQDCRPGARSGRGRRRIRRTFERRSFRFERLQSWGPKDEDALMDLRWVHIAPSCRRRRHQREHQQGHMEGILLASVLVGLCSPWPC